jgi:hypothetical protein
MQILSTRSKVSSRRFYESFTFNKRCKSYVHDNGIETCLRGKDGRRKNK